MVDSLNASLRFNNAGEYVSQFLDNPKPFGESKIRGKLKNYTIIADKYYIKATGSISKFIQRDNIHCIDHEQMKLAFEEMSDFLHLPMQKAKPIRIDISNSFCMEKSANTYFYLFANKPRYYKSEEPNGVYYKTGVKKKVYGFYNKTKEAGLKGINLLRAELTIKDIAQTLKIPNNELTIERIGVNEMNHLISLWLKHYYQINKISQAISYEKIKKKTQLKNLALAMAVNNPTSYQVLEAINKTNKANGVIDRFQYRRLNEAIGIARKSKFNKANPLIKELDRKFEATAAVYMN